MLEYFQRLPTGPPPPDREARIKADFRRLKTSMNALQNTSQTMKELMMNQGLTAEVQTINQQMQNLHEAIVQIRSTHESILSITTSMRSTSSRYGAASQTCSVKSRTSQHTSTSAAGRRQLRMEIAASQAQQTTLQQAEQIEFETAHAQAQA